MPDMGWFIKNGCELTKPDLEIFVGVFGLANGNPCNGCNCKDTCPAWPLLRAQSQSGPSDRPLCPQCKSPLNMAKVERRGGKCACGAKV